MIPFSGLLFFYVSGLLLLPAVVLGLLGKSLRGYGMAFSLVMLLVVFGENGQLVHLAVFAVWELAVCGLFWRVRGKGKWLFRGAVALAALPLVLVKIGEVSDIFALFRLMGISYMTFRAVQAVILFRDGGVKELRVGELAYFILFFPAVSSGPIDRYGRFLEDLHRPGDREEYRSLLSQGVWKLVGGAFSAIVLGGLVQNLWLASLPEKGFLAALSYMYGYTVFLFFNFAGSSSMAIGMAYLLGVRLPENFRQPFLSVDMKDFWARWHISLSAWLRDYVYTRFVRGALKARRFKNPRTASYLGYVLTMMTMGAWHGLAPRYLVYGVYHSLLMCLNEALDLHWKGFRRTKRQGAGQVACVLVTFHLFSFGLLIFSGRLF